MKTKTYPHVLPSWSICPIHNDDVSGIDNDDIKNLDRFYEGLERDLKELGASHYTIGIPEGESYFAHMNDIDSLGNDVYDVDITFFWAR